jgi:hypothetical protein
LIAAPQVVKKPPLPPLSQRGVMSPLIEKGDFGVWTFEESAIPPQFPKLQTPSRIIHIRKIKDGLESTKFSLIHCYFKMF